LIAFAHACQIFDQELSRMMNWTALVTLLAVVFYFYTGLRVGSARQKYGIKAPAITGNPDFERVFRVQMNTLEWMPIFLPALWLFAAYVGDIAAAAIGVVWIVGRFLYLTGYSEAAAKRGPWLRHSSARLRYPLGRSTGWDRDAAAAWGMTGYAADFRWLRARDDSPWYPTARLIRQPAFGDWESVIERARRLVGAIQTCAPSGVSPSS
jgi:glutathione S-transferase